MPTATKARALKAVPAQQTVDPPRGPENAVHLGAVKIDRIHPSPDNPRRDLGDLTELAHSIKEQGILEPLIVSPVAGGDPHNPRTKFDLIAGHRRFAAAQLARQKTVPVLVRADLVGAKADEARLVENLQRTDLSPIDEALAYERLIRVHGYRQADVALAIGRNQGHVSKRLALLRLPDEAQRMIDAQTINVNDGVDLARLTPAALTHALVDIKGGSDASIAIRAASAWAERDAERTAAVKTLQKQGVRVIQSDGPVTYDAKKGPLALKFMGWVDFAAHGKEACHAAIVGPAPIYSSDEKLSGPVDRWATFVCTEPTNHLQADDDGDEETANMAAAEAARKARADQARRFEAATTERRAFIATLISKGRARLSRQAAFEHLARASLLEAACEVAYSPTEAAFDLAAEWLGVEPYVPTGRSKRKPRTVRDLIVHGVIAEAKTPDQVLKPSLAVRMAVDELAFVDQSAAKWDNVHGPLLAEHIRFLQVAGYQLTDPEQDHLSEFADLAAYLQPA